MHVFTQYVAKGREESSTARDAGAYGPHALGPRGARIQW